MSYIVPPGLYAVGQPTPDSPVIVTANYKMTYDLVRQALVRCDAWLLVLETYGINVWCAAVMGTFGTQEIVRQVVSSRLVELVNHRSLVLPILGAPGVAAHQVKSQCGFLIRYAANRAADLPEYLGNGMQTTPVMRALSFSLAERLVLIPVELVLELKAVTLIALAVLLGFSLAGSFADGLQAFSAYAGAFGCGIALTPVLLPWLSGRRFALKGALLGLLWTCCCYFLSGGGWPLLVTLAAVLVLPAVSAYHALNFTGCTPYTSRSGVRKELRNSLPVMAGAVGTGLLLLLISLFV